MRKTLIICAFLILLFPSAYSSDKPDLFYFFSTSCDKCMHIKDHVMPGLEARFKDDINVVYKDIGDVENYKFLFSLKSKYSEDEKAVFPVLYLKGNVIDRRDLEIDDELGKIALFIVYALKNEKNPLAQAKQTNPLEHFKTFTLPAVIVAGLVDGINPCSFTVLVFFISFLSLQRFTKKNIIISGVGFIIASFFTYLLIGLGLFGSLYAAKGYSVIIGIVTALVGIFSILLGAVSLYDAITFLKTKRPERSILKLPAGIRDNIHRLIRTEYSGKGAAVKIFFTSLTIGFSISILESVCTGQLYLPTIVFVLKSAPHKLQALLYLITYNLMFIVPLAVIFLLALIGVTSKRFSDIFRRYFFIIKVLLALLFFVLGATLVFAEETAPVKRIGSKLETKVISSPPKPKRPNDDFYWDFGKVIEGDVLKHKFFIRNDTKSPFMIKQVNTSCSCTVSTVEKDTVLPGKKVPITVQFDTKGYPGERTRYTYVHTDSDKVGIIVFEIQADVGESKD